MTEAGFLLCRDHMRFISNKNRSTILVCISSSCFCVALTMHGVFTGAPGLATKTGDKVRS